MPGLVHYAAFGGACADGGGNEAAPEAVSGDVRGVEACGGGAGFEHPGNGARGDGGVLHGVPFPEAWEEAARAGEPGGPDPGSELFNGVDGGAAGEDAFCHAFAGLVGLAAADVDEDALSAVRTGRGCFEVVHAEGGELGAAEGAAEANGDQGAVAEIDESVLRNIAQDEGDGAGGERGLFFRFSSQQAGGGSHGSAYFLGGGGRWKAAGSVQA